MIHIPYTPLHRLSIASGGASVPAEAPSLALVSKTTTTITVTHTPPADTTNYSFSQLFVNGDDDATSSTAENITITGLTAGTRYVIYAVSESSGGAQLGSSNVLIVDTPAATSSDPVVSIKQAIRDILVTVSGIDSSTVHARRRKPTGKSTNTMQSLFEVSGNVDCWEIEEESAASQYGAVDVAWHHLPDTFIVRSWREWDDSNNTIDAHRATATLAIDALNADHTLGGTVTRHRTAQLRRYGELEMKAGRLCSVLEIVIATQWTRKP